MNPFKKAAKKLEKLKTQEASINQLHEQFLALDPSSPSETAIKTLRNSFEVLFADAFKKKNKKMAKATHLALLALAEMQPINNVDPISQGEFTPETKTVFVSTGYRFDLEYFTQYADKPENKNKELTNFFNRQSFHKFDNDHLKQAMSDYRWLHEDDSTPTNNETPPVSEPVSNSLINFLHPGEWERTTSGGNTYLIRRGNPGRRGSAANVSNNSNNPVQPDISTPRPTSSLFGTPDDDLFGPDDDLFTSIVSSPRPKVPLRGGLFDDNDDDEPNHSNNAAQPDAPSSTTTTTNTLSTSSHSIFNTNTTNQPSSDVRTVLADVLEQEATAAQSPSGLSNDR